ncbi:MAG: type II toxin-antitoxin system RelE/ParE family toxin [Bacteroidetes bacterium]|nr:type II toxin-antitoxin system RelE/ParE family toxin [Bacteroidota bacterium]
MSLEIVFTDDASEMLLSITRLIESKWGSKQANKFLSKTYKTIDLISKQPYLFKASLINENVRICILTKQTSFFYEIHDSKIIILFFWDNRQDPIFIG